MCGLLWLKIENTYAPRCSDQTRAVSRFPLRSIELSSSHLLGNCKWKPQPRLLQFRILTKDFPDWRNKASKVRKQASKQAGIRVSETSIIFVQTLVGRGRDEFGILIRERRLANEQRHDIS